ncbi:MAG: helix-turn-helix domain-containing protein [Pseudomonadota bacterium]
MNANSNAIMSIDELSDYLKISKSTLYKLSQEGKIPSQKVGRHWRYRKEAIDIWLDEFRANKSKNQGDR